MSILLSDIPGVGGGYENDRDQYDQILVDGLADAIVRNAEAAESDVGAAAVVSSAVQQLAMRPTLQRAVLQKAAPILAANGQKYAIYLKNLEAFGFDDSPHQMIPVDSGSTLIAAGAASGVFTLTPNVTFVLTDMIVTEAMTEKFGLLLMKAGGFDYLSLGFGVVGNGTQACLTLAAFGSDWQIRRPLPFLGREFMANTNLQIQVQEVQAMPNRFMMGVGVYFKGICDALLPPAIRRKLTQSPGYSIYATQRQPTSVLR
jgi:hypothetical protein